MLFVIGRRSPPFRREQQRPCHMWLPQTEDAKLDTTHMLQMEDAAGAAHALAEFLAHHPIG